MCESFEPDWNVTAERDWHPLKQLSQRTLVELGMKIEESDEHERNAESSILESFDSGVNVTVKREVHPSKQF
jgi:hypothetical protein